MPVGETERLFLWSVSRGVKLLAILSVFTTLLILGISLSRTADSLLAKRGDDAERVFRDTLAAKR